MEKYRNYNNGKFDIQKWENPVNGNWIKPRSGGLWASPVESSWSWKDWCEAENFYDKPFSEVEYFDFSLSEHANVYEINSVYDLKRFKYGRVEGLDLEHGIKTFPRYIIDFEKASEEYDAIFLTTIGESTTRYSDPYSLYGWDCESILILNKEIIEDIEYHEPIML